MTERRGPVEIARDEVARGERTAEAVTREALAAIARQEPALSAFTLVAAEHAQAQAVALDRARAGGAALGPLAGVPIAVKDNICTRGVQTTAGSKILAGFVPPYDATVVERLAAAGAVVVGKTNCDEFAMGSSTENSAFGPTANPVGARLTRPVARAAGRQPRSPRARCRPLSAPTPAARSASRRPSAASSASSPPTAASRATACWPSPRRSIRSGPSRPTVEDAAIVLAAIAGHDPRDATSADQPVPVPGRARQRDMRGLRIGVPRAFIEGVDPSVASAFDATLDVWRALGAVVVDVSLPHASLAIPVYYLVATAEASSNLARYDGVRYGFRAPLASDDSLRTMYERTRDAGFGAEVKRRIMLGTYVLSAGYYDAYYLKAQQVRATLRDDYATALATVDVVATPTTPTPAFKLGEKVADPLQMYLADIFTVSANLVGLPAISLPCGMSPDGLPIGCQLTGRMWDESTLIDATASFQSATEWHLLAPPIAVA